MKLNMRKVLAILATLAMLCTVLPLGSLFSAMADDANLIANGDFETGTAGWYASAGTTIEAVDGALHGDYNENWGFIGYDITLEPNSDYVLTFDAKAINNGGVTVKLNKTDWTGTVQSSPCEFGTEWQTFTWEFNSGSYGPMWLYFQSNCEAGANQEIWLDNISLIKVAGGSEPETPDEPEVPADGNLIVNGDFETGDNSGWEIWQSTSISADAAKDSAYGAHLVGDGGWGGLLNQTMTVVAGKQYKLSFWINVNASGVNVQVKDGAGKSIEGAGGWFDSNKKDKLVEWTFTATDNTVFLNFCGSGSAPEDAYVDNFSLVALGDTPDAPVDDALVKNGGFETGDLTNWTNLWDSCTVEFVEGYESTHAVHITAGSWSQVRQNMIPVEPNTDYVLTADYKYAENFALMVKKGDDSGDVASVMLESSSKWAKGTLEFNTGDLTAVCVLLIGWDGGGDAIIDNVVLAKKGEPVQPNEPVVPDEPVVGDTVLDVNFDDGEFGGVLSSSDISIADGELQFNVTKDWGNIYAELAVEANADYKVSFRAKSKLGKSVWVKFHKADWTGDIVQADATIGTEWKDYTFTLNSGDNTALWLLVQYAGYASEGETIWFDSIKVEKIGGGSAPVVPTGNLIVNGDFETGDATGWETWQSTTISADAAKDGSFGANLIGDGGWGGMLNQSVTVVAGQKYKLSFWLSVNKTGVNVQVKDGSGSAIEGAGGWFDANNVNKVVEWTFTAPDNTVLINFCGSGSAAEDVYVDNFVLEAVDVPAPSAGLVTNGDFETGDATGWETWQSTVVSAEAAKNGSYGVNLIGNGGWGGLLNQTFKVEKGETYTITLWVCVNTSGANLQIKGADKIEEECDNTYLDSKELSGWTQRTFNVIANSDEITLNFCGGGTNVAEDLYIDDIVVVKKGETPPVDDTYPIKNAGFETGDLTGWKNLWDACTYTFENKGYNGSNFALNQVASGQWQQIRQDMIPVEPNTDYVVVGYVKNPMNVNIVVKTGDDSANINEVAIENDFSNKWVRAAVEFNSGDLNAVCVLLISREAGASAIWDNVQIYVKGTEPTDVINDEEVTEGPIVLDSFGVSINRPATPEANLIQNGSFEDAEGGQWQSVINDTLYVVDDETAPNGNKSLFFNTSGVTENNKVIFYLDVEPNTDYVFSAWVKGAFISENNRFNATFGTTDWKDNFMVYSDAQFSNKNRQIVPTAWDNEWHLRSVQFNSGVNTKIGIGFAGAESQMWIDDMALYTVENGIKYADARQNYYIIATPMYENEGACADEHNLIANATMDAGAEEFWSSAEGYRNGFLSFPENEYEYGVSLKYTGDDKSCYTNAIKWLEVKPNTQYTFSVDVRVVKTGGGSLNLVDGKKRDCNEFLMIDFDQYGYGVDWFNVTIDFNSGEFDRLGISIVDGGGEALIDNMRLFESEYRIEGGIVDDYVEPPYSFGDPEDPEDPMDPNNPDSPVTGVSVLGAALAVALVPSSALVAFKRRKKEDEE